MTSPLLGYHIIENVFKHSMPLISQIPVILSAAFANFPTKVTYRDKIAYKRGTINQPKS